MDDNAHGGAVRAKRPPYRVINVNLLIAHLNVLFPDKSHFYDATIPEVRV
jgi:hypothetical protein